VLAASPALAANVPSYAINKDKSVLKFYAIQNGAAVAGNFSDYTAEIKFEPEQLDKSSIKVEVATGSVSVSNADVQKNIVLPDWLSTEAFPKATFVSKKISRTPGTSNYFAEGELTLRGKTAPVTLNFSLTQTGDVAIAKGIATLNRNDYGVGQGQWAKDDVINNAVRVEFRIFAVKSN
jgi:polyisoprenoid-binding protein YceI